MHHQMGDVMVKWLICGLRLGLAGIKGDGNVAQFGIGPIGLGQLRHGARLRGPPFGRGPAEHIGGAGFAPKIRVQRGDTGIVTGEKRDFEPIGIEAKMGQCGTRGGLGQRFKTCRFPTRIFDERINQQARALARGPRQGKRKNAALGRGALPACDPPEYFGQDEARGPVTRCHRPRMPL